MIITILRVNDFCLLVLSRITFYLFNFLISSFAKCDLVWFSFSVKISLKIILPVSFQEICNFSVRKKLMQFFLDHFYNCFFFVLFFVYPSTRDHLTPWILILPTVLIAFLRFFWKCTKKWWRWKLLQIFPQSFAITPFIIFLCAYLARPAVAMTWAIIPFIIRSSLVSLKKFLKKTWFHRFWGFFLLVVFKEKLLASSNLWRFNSTKFEGPSYRPCSKTVSK